MTDSAGPSRLVGADTWHQYATIQERPLALGPGPALATDVWGREKVDLGTTAHGIVNLWCKVIGDGRVPSPFVLTIHVGKADSVDAPALMWPTIPEIRECLGRFTLRGALFIPAGVLLLASDNYAAWQPEPLTFLQGGAVGPSPAQTRIELSAPGGTVELPHGGQGRGGHV